MCIGDDWLLFSIGSEASHQNLTSNNTLNNNMCTLLPTPHCSGEKNPWLH